MSDKSFIIVPPRHVPGLDIGLEFVRSLNGVGGDLSITVDETMSLDQVGGAIELGVQPNYFLRTSGGTITGNLNISPAPPGPYGLKLLASPADPTDTAAGAIYFNTNSVTLRVYTGSAWADLAQAGALTQGVADGLYLRLDGTNDPLSGDLDMGSSIFRFGNIASDPVSGHFGDVYYNLSTHRLRVYAGPVGAWSNVTSSQSGTTGRLAAFADPTSIGNSAVWQDVTGVSPGTVTVARGASGDLVLKVGSASLPGVTAVSIDTDSSVASTTAGVINIPSSTSSSRGVAFGTDTLYRSTPAVGVSIRSSVGFAADTVLGAALSGATHQFAVNTDGTAVFRPQYAAICALDMRNFHADDDSQSTAGTKIRIRNSTDTDDLFYVDSSGYLQSPNKSFKIPHPTKPGMKLVYGCLEGPEHGVYFRGSVIAVRGLHRVDLPEYWASLCPGGYSVLISPLGGYGLFVAERSDSCFWVRRRGLMGFLPYGFDYLVVGEREPIVVEQ